MKRVALTVTAAMALVALGTTSRLSAQMMPFNPPVSPYLNLLRGSQSPGINWMNLVQPQMQLMGAVNQLQMGQNVLGQAVSGGGNANQMMVTGHPAMFGPNYLWFYYLPRMGMGMGGMGMGGMGMGGMGMRGGMGGMGMGGMGMGGMGMGGMGMGGMGMGGMGMGGMGMGGMGMGGMGMGGMGMGGMGMGGMGMGGMGMGGMGRGGMPR